MEFSRPEYWSGQPIPSPLDLPNPGIEPGSSALQVDSLPTELSGKPLCFVLLSRSVVSTLCDPMYYSLSGSSVHGDSLGKNTGVGSLSLLQEIFPSQESNQGLLHYRRILHHLSYQEIP